MTLSQAMIKKIRVGSNVRIENIDTKNRVVGWDFYRQELFFFPHFFASFKEVISIDNQNIPDKYPKIFLNREYEIKNIQDNIFGSHEAMEEMNGLLTKVVHCGFHNFEEEFFFTVFYKGREYYLGKDQFHQGKRLKARGI